jgi:hypothetical protein
MTFKNMTPHAIRLNDGTELLPSGEVASVDQITSEFDEAQIATSSFGELTLPEPEENTILVTSMIVAQAASAAGRTDVVAPATRHKDTVRNEKGHIVSVPGFLRFE